MKRYKITKFVTVTKEYTTKLYAIDEKDAISLANESTVSWKDNNTKDDCNSITEYEIILLGEA